MWVKLRKFYKKMLRKCIIPGCTRSDTWSKSIEIDNRSSFNGVNSTIAHWSSGSDYMRSHPSTQSNDSHTSQSPSQQGGKKQVSFLVQISNTGLSKLRTEWNPWVPRTVLHSHACEQSMSTTSQKNLSTCLFLVDSTRIADSPQRQWATDQTSFWLAGHIRFYDQQQNIKTCILCK